MSHRRPWDLLRRLRTSNADAPVIETLYGPTAVNATVGNGGLSIGIAADGTVTVLRWPSPSYWDHLRFLTTSRERHRWGARPAEGLFSGIVWADRSGGRHLRWARDATDIGQSYLDDDDDTVVTVHRFDDLGLELAVTDTVDGEQDVLERHHEIRRTTDGAATAIRLVAFASIHPTIHRLPLAPVWDSYLDALHAGHGRVEADAVVWEAAGQDRWTHRHRSVALRLAWDTGGHLRRRRYGVARTPTATDDAEPYTRARAAPPDDPGRRAPCQGRVDAVLGTDLDPARRAAATLRLGGHRLQPTRQPPWTWVRPPTPSGHASPGSDRGGTTGWRTPHCPPPTSPRSSGTPDAR
ncbi:MAG: hypothetical protein U5R31_07415 [Acidimicrobiia bacterium]|nr:hypothetical protein [Acidimicrobiia bacterium]